MLSLAKPENKLGGGKNTGLFSARAKIEHNSLGWFRVKIFCSLRGLYIGEEISSLTGFFGMDGLKLRGVVRFFAFLVS